MRERGPGSRAGASFDPGVLERVRPVSGSAADRRVTLLAIALGGALGAPARYELAQLIHVSKDTFPWATFCTNVSGAFALGLLMTLLGRVPVSRPVAPFLAVGFLGAYTTFSTMAVETTLLAKDGYAGLGALYLLASVAAGMAAVFSGIACARAIPVKARGGEER